MPKIISIPTPCHEDWNAMMPDEQGRHCLQCCKTVVDFTEWQPQEILFYLQENAAKKVCGRFAADQLNEEIVTPEDFVMQLGRFPMPFLRKAAAIFLFAFSVMAVSCNEKNLGQTAAIESAHVDSPPPRMTGDTILIEPAKGEPALIKTPKKEPVKKCTEILKGDVAVIEPPQQLTGLVAVKPPPVFQDSTKQTYKTGKVAFSDTAKMHVENSHKSAVNK